MKNEIYFVFSDRANLFFFHISHLDPPPPPPPPLPPEK